MKNTLSFTALFILVSSMAIANIPNYAYADSQSDSMIRIATQARDQLKIQLLKTDASQEIRDKFELGSAELQLLIEAAKIEDSSSARKHFLSSMKIFNEIIQQISETSTQATLSATSPSQSRVLQELDRLERYLDRIKEISNKNQFDIDFTSVDQLIDLAKTQINSDNPETTNSTIESIKLSINELNNILNEKTKQNATNRAKTFAEKHLEELDKLIVQATEIGVSQNIIDQLISARENLNSASDVEQIIAQVKHIILVKQQYEDTKKERLQSRISQIETKLDRLSSSTEELPNLDKAKIMFEELLQLISKQNLNEAIQILNSLNNLLNEIESSLNERESMEKEPIEETSSSLADTKIDRIKIKIERLESEMNQLAEKIDENAAAKRWLNNAFALLENAKNQVDESPNDALEAIMNIEEILSRIQKTIQ